MSSLTLISRLLTMCYIDAQKVIIACFVYTTLTLWPNRSVADSRRKRFANCVPYEECDLFFLLANGISA